MPRVIPQTPFQAVNQPIRPYATSPAAAHALLHPGRVLARYPVVSYLTGDIRNYPMALMQQYYPPGASDVQALQGLGADPNAGVLAAVAGLGVALLVAGAAVRGIAGYYVGKTVAPSREDEGKYAWGGAVAGILLGPVGMAATAGVGLMSKDH
jgi:hypothetical protein